MFKKITAITVLSAAIVVTAAPALAQGPPGSQGPPRGLGRGAPVKAEPCDRQCLIGMIDQYLEALMKHDSSGLPLARNVKFTEDTRREYRAFQSPFSKSDIKTGEAAFLALEHEGENLLQYWGTEKFPYWGTTPDGRDLTSLGYRAATRSLGMKKVFESISFLRRVQ